MTNIKNLKIKIFADGASIDDMISLNRKNYISGFTTNPSLMKQARIIDYKTFAITKIFNKLFSRDKSSIKREIKISNNLLVNFLFKLEEKLYYLYYPFGIRCFVIAKKL